MINLLANKQLNIILPNTNKALAEVVKSATPKEIATLSQDLSQGKDLKSIMNSLLKQVSQGSSANKELLNLVKNNPTLKSLGSVGDTIKDLLSTIKLDKTPLPIESKLKSFLVDIKDLNQPILKQKVENSGILLESKLKNVQNPQVEVKALLTSLTKALDKSQIFNVTVLSEKLKEVLNTKVISESSNKTLIQVPTDDKKTLGEISKQLNSTLTKLQAHLKNMDVINSPKLSASIAKLEHLIEPKMLNTENIKPQSIKETLKQINTQLLESKNQNIKTVVDGLVKIESKLVLKELQLTPDKVKQLDVILPKLQANIKSLDLGNAQKMAVLVSKIESLKVANTQETLVQINSQLSQTVNPQTKTLLDALEKIFASLKTDSSTESLLDKKVPQEIKSNLDSLKDIMKKMDIVFSKEVLSTVNKLTSLSSQTQLSSHNNVKEIISNDLKAILNQANAEISKSEHPNKDELLKKIDKLTLQIDYSQLLSNLSSTTSLYVPFAWEQMKEGQINIHSDKEERFYVDIDLKLEEYGSLSLKLVMYDKNQLNIQIYSENQEFKELIKENIPSLRSALIENEITPREIRIFDTKKTKQTSAYENIQTDINMGFEVKA